MSIGVYSRVYSRVSSSMRGAGTLGGEFSDMLLANDASSSSSS